MEEKYLFDGYLLNYYFQPGKNSSLDTLNKIHQQFLIINQESGRNFRYGIFDPNISEEKKKDFYSKCMVCIIEDGNGDPAGLFYNYIMPYKESYINHLGLVLIHRNKGINLLNTPYVLANFITKKHLGNGYVTNISSTPSIVAQVSDVFSEVWPGYNTKLVKPPYKEYKEVAETLYADYIKNFFPDPEKILFDPKRFIIRSASKEMGFEINFRKLSRAETLEGNLFCLYWIDYNLGEDLIQVGKLDQKFEEVNFHKLAFAQKI